MGTKSRLRRIVADFLCTDGDEPGERGAERQLEAAKTVAALAVAQAQGTQIELQEALTAEETSQTRLAELVARLKEERERARHLVASYREAQHRAVEDLKHRGEAARAAGLNRAREELRRFVARAEATVDEWQLQEIEAELRAEAARLDVLEALDRGDAVAQMAERPSVQTEDVTARARAILAEEAYADLLQEQ